jgi:hypothetical protein
MIKKAKNDQPHSLADTLLFTQRFEFVSHYDVQQIVNNIGKLSQVIKLGWPPRSITTWVSPLPDGGHEFEAWISFTGQGISRPLAIAVGEVYHDAERGLTVIKGKVRLDAWVYGVNVIGMLQLVVLYSLGWIPPAMRLP